MNKAVYIFLFELLLAVVFTFFYMGIWVSDAPGYTTMSERFSDTGYVAVLHLIFAIGGFLLINVSKD